MKKAIAIALATIPTLTARGAAFAEVESPTKAIAAAVTTAIFLNEFIYFSLFVFPNPLGLELLVYHIRLNLSRKSLTCPGISLLSNSTILAFFSASLAEDEDQVCISISGLLSFTV